MVINTNLTGAGETPLAKSCARPKTVSPANVTSGSGATAGLDSQIGRMLAGAGLDIPDEGAALQSAQLAQAGILQQPQSAMLAQANLTPETVLRLLQE